MENFIVSARKYRPATFDTVVGQQTITNTLKNAIRTNQLAQAFLFCGPRGVGKTTCARILAKTINCEKPTPSVEPCNQCTSCVTFNDSSTFIIHELDAASNNSVDDIRSLVDQVRIPPQMGKYKVYIIDEVHMLSNQAFNAFLKTLEEPPSYAKFILATTEKHKIIPTILSRCQIFDFKRITVQDIAAHLAYVASKEGVAADPEALHIIAQKADGALRDALSIFDQMVLLGNNDISRLMVIDNLNVLDYDYYFRITDHMMSGNYKDTLLILNEIIEKGFDGQHFITGLGEHFRNLLMCNDPETVKLIETSDSVKEKYLEQARNVPVQFLINSLDINNKSDIGYRASNNKRLNLEVALIQMCQYIQPVSTSTTPPAGPHKTMSSDAPAAVNASSATVQHPAKAAGSEKSGEKTAESPTESPSLQPAVPPAETAIPLSVKPSEPKQKEEPPKVTSPVHTDSPEKFPATSMQSVKSILSQGSRVAPKAEQEVAAIQRKEPLNPETVLKAILTFADRLKEESSMLYTALTAHEPEIGENATILLPLDNPILQKEINKYWNDLLEFLKNELRNDTIQLETVVSAQTIEAKKFLSDKDKLDAMKQKNPELNSLMDQLNLELDV